MTIQKTESQIKLTAKQELFAVLSREPELSLAAAYRMAYDVSPDTAIETVYSLASRLKSNVKIRARIHELELEAVSNRAISTEELRQELRHTALDAQEDRAHAPRLKALELLGKLDGVLVDRREVNITEQSVTIELSTEELRAIAASGLSIAAQRGLTESQVIDGELIVLPTDPPPSAGSI